MDDIEKMVEKIGQIIRNLREAKGLSRKDLAQKCGLSPRILARIEDGGRRTKLNELQAIATALNRKASEFFAMVES